MASLNVPFRLEVLRVEAALAFVKQAEELTAKHPESAAQIARLVDLAFPDFKTSALSRKSYQDGLLEIIAKTPRGKDTRVLFDGEDISNRVSVLDLHLTPNADNAVLTVQNEALVTFIPRGMHVKMPVRMRRQWHPVVDPIWWHPRVAAGC